MADDADEILARFPGPATLVPSRMKWIMVMLTGAAFSVAGVFLMPKNEAMTWFCMVFFGLVAAIGLIMLLPGAGGLTLRREDFEVTSLFRRHTVSWADASDFIAGRIPPAMTKMVLYNHAAAKNIMLGKLNTSIAGRNGALNDTYGLDADALANLMMQWRERAMASR
jgi:hypothetical protein